MSKTCVCWDDYIDLVELLYTLKKKKRGKNSINQFQRKTIKIKDLLYIWKTLCLTDNCRLSLSCYTPSSCPLLVFIFNCKIKTNLAVCISILCKEQTKYKIDDDLLGIVQFDRHLSS